MSFVESLETTEKNKFKKFGVPIVAQQKRIQLGTNLTPSLGTSICCGCGPKKQKKKKVKISNIETLFEHYHRKGSRSHEVK